MHLTSGKKTKVLHNLSLPIRPAKVSEKKASNMDTETPQKCFENQGTKFILHISQGIRDVSRMKTEMCKHICVQYTDCMKTSQQKHPYLHHSTSKCRLS
jgi:hypothetical protein